MNWNPVSFIKRIGAPYRMRSWGDPVFSSNVDIANIIEVEQYLRAQCNISPDKPIWNRKPTDKRVLKIRWRKWLYDLFDFLAKTSPPLGLISFVHFLSTINLNALYFSMLLILTSPVSWLIRNEMSKNKGENSVTLFLSDELTSEETRLLEKEITSLQQRSKQFFWLGIYKEIFEVPIYALNEDYGFLLFTGVERDRKGIWLKGQIPTGKIMVIRQERMITRNSRSYEIQKSRMSNANKTKALYDEIRNKTQKSPKLGVGKQVRLMAILYITENSELWNGIRSENKSIDDEENSKHKNNLNKIFEPATRSKSTLSDSAASNMLFEFVDLKDRTLENWLRELNIKKSG